MAKFEVLDKTGRRFVFEGDVAPTESEIDQYIADYDKNRGFELNDVYKPLQQFAQGATFGFADEASAGFDALTDYAGNKLAKALTGKADIIPADSPYNKTGQDREATLKDYYNRNLNRERGMMKQYQEKHPVISTALQVAGGVGNPVGRGLSTPATLGGKVAQGAGLGAGLGALYGFGSGEGAGDRLSSGLTSGAIGGAVGAAVPLVKAGLKELVGFTTGTGGKAVEQATEAGKRGSKTFTENMRGKVSQTQVVKDLNAELSKIQQQADRSFDESLTPIAKNKVDITPITKGLQNIYDDAMEGSVNTMSASRKRVFDEAVDAVNDFVADPKSQTVRGIHALKRKIGEIALSSEDKAGLNMRTKLYHLVEDQIQKASPEYSKMMKDYSGVADLINSAQKELSAGSYKNAYTALGKLQGALRNNAGTRYGARQEVIDKLGISTELKDAIAGQAMSSFLPRGGIAGLLGAGNLMLSGIGGLMTPIKTATRLSVSSPRLMGEVLYGLGRASNYAPSQQTLLKAILSGTQGE